MNPSTIISDIDGTLFQHKGDITKQHFYPGKELLLPGTLDKIRNWNKNGFYILLVSGRKESTRKHTEQQLSDAGIIYDSLILGVTSGNRIIINDMKSNSTEPTCQAVNVERNEGLKNYDC